MIQRRAYVAFDRVVNHFATRANAVIDGSYRVINGYLIFHYCDWIDLWINSNAFVQVNNPFSLVETLDYSNFWRRRAVAVLDYKVHCFGHDEIGAVEVYQLNTLQHTLERMNFDLSDYDVDFSTFSVLGGDILVFSGRQLGVNHAPLEIFWQDTNGV